jgi:type IV pilus assembly protein PilV
MTKLLPKQDGVMLIEALVGILIFAIGILALIAMQATAIRATQDARYRTEAVNYANQLLSQILVNIDRTDPVTIQNSLAAFQHQANTNGNCSYSGAAAASAVVTDWVELITGTSGLNPPPLLALPGTTAEKVQVRVDTGVGAYNTVAITVCWQAPDDPVARKHVLISYVT